MNHAESSSLSPAIALGLVALTLALFAPAVGYGFINFDDPLYVAENPHVLAGLSGPGLAWAFNVGYAGNWHPLTWLSHMLDVELFGADPRLHHLTSLLLHATNGVLLFVLLQRLLARARPGLSARSAALACGFVAAVFLIHPQRLESVVWISERKDVLATFFWLLTLLAYVRYTGRPRAGAYLSVVVLMALGLMAKPSLVTLPLVLLLLDLWPLGRLGPRGQGGRRGLLLEKLPLALLALGSAGLTLVAQHRGGAINSAEVISLSQRVGNAFVGYASYVRDLFIPTSVAVFYPIPPRGWPLWIVLGSASPVIAITGFAALRARRFPWFAAGWSWFLVTLVPMIGLIQVGAQARADRYTYIPQIGLIVAATWAVAALSRKLPARRIVLGVAGAIALAGLAWSTHAQLPNWRNSRLLFERAASVARYNYLALYGLAREYAASGEWERSAHYAAAALELHPGHTPSRLHLGYCHGMLGRLDEAVQQIGQVLRANPQSAEAYRTLGAVYLENGRPWMAVASLERAVGLAPGDAETYTRLGLARERSGDPAGALRSFSRAIALDPGSFEARLGAGRLVESIREDGDGAGATDERLDAGNGAGDG